MDVQHSKAIAFGKEPCYSLKQGNKNFLCPYFDQCLRTKMLRECYTAHPLSLQQWAGFAAFRRREGKRGDFDCLSELGRYLEALMTQKESAEIAQTCPILSSLQKGHSI